MMLEDSDLCNVKKRAALFKYCLKHEQQCFIGFKNTRRS